jgi:hypothetical protein
MMKNFAVSFILLFVCVAVFSEESPTLSIHDIVGTYRLDRIENPWFSDEVREKVNNVITSQRSTFVIGEDYYISRGFRVEVVFSTVEIVGIKGARYVPESRANLSEFRHLFMDIPRLFDSVIVNNGSPLVIEVFDYDTVVIESENSYLLYRRVE